MKKLLIVAAVLGLAAPLGLSAVTPAEAGGKSAKSYKSRTHVVRRGLFGKRRIVVRSKVMGFTARVGGYSFNVGKTYTYDPLAPRPDDWIRNDFSPPRNSIIPNSPYP